MNIRTVSFILLALCNLFWAGNYLIGKPLTALMDPIWITYLRWLFASVILMVISVWFEKPDLKTIRKNLPSLILMGLFSMVGYNTLLYTALQYTAPISASIINALNPALLAVLSVFFLAEKMTVKKTVGILITMFGAVIVVTHGDWRVLVAMDFNLGDMLMLGAITVWSLFSIVSKRLKDIKPLTATAFSALLAVLMMTPVVLYLGNFPTQWNTSMVLSMVYIILFPSIGSFLFWNFSIRHLEAGLAGISMNLVPVFLAGLTWAVGQDIGSSQLIGGGIVILGVLISSDFIKRKKKTA